MVNSRVVVSSLFLVLVVAPLSVAGADASPGASGGLGDAQASWDITSAGVEAGALNLGPIEVIQDGSFELGTPNPFWNQFSTSGADAIIDSGVCGPRTGSWWVWFNGASLATQYQVDQDVLLPNGATATLTFYLQRPIAGEAERSSGDLEARSAGKTVLQPPSSVTVNIDSTPVFTADENNTTYWNNYALVTVDVSGFADGGVHNVGINGDLDVFDFDGFCIDDVSLTAPDPACADPDYGMPTTCTSTLIAPADGATDVPLTPTFQYQCVNNADEYVVILDDGGGPFAACVSSTTSCAPASPLAADTTYTVYVEGWDTSWNEPICVSATHSFTTQAAPIADFTWFPTNPDVGELVQFTDLSTNSPTSWSWNFGDGTTSTLQNPSHAFGATGSYTVTLTATNAVGGNTTNRTVTVGSAPVAAFTWMPTVPDVGEVVQFTDTSLNGPTSWSWDFGDGGTSAAPNPTHSYAAVGQYTVTLTVTNPLGVGSLSQLLTVGAAPDAGFTWSPISPKVGDPVQFTDTSTGNPTWREWDFGDGHRSTQVNPIHTFEVPGTMAVSLSIGNSSGSDYAIELVTVRQDHLVTGGGEIPVSDPGVDVGPRSSTSVDRSGNRVVVWQQPPPDGAKVTQDGSSAVFGRFFGAGDDAGGEMFEAGAATEGEDASPTVDFDAGGDFVVAWQAGSTAGAFGRTFGSDQAPDGDAFQVSELGGQALDPSVATASSGEFVVAWRQVGGKVMQAGGIFGRMFNPDGDAQGGSFQIDGGGAGTNPTNPSTSRDASGNVVVVWNQDDPSKQGGGSVFGRFFDPSGSPTTDPDQVDNGVGEAADPDTAAGSSGHVVVVWQQRNNKDGGWNIFGRQFSSEGQAQGEQFLINDQTAGDQTNPSVDVNAAGDFTVAWESSHGSGQGVYGRFFEASGQPVGGQFEVNTQAVTSPAEPDVAVADDDTIGVVYTRRQSAGVERGVFMRTFTVVDVASECDQSATTNCLRDDRFQVSVTWRDFDNNTGGGQAVRMTGDTGYHWFFDQANVEVTTKVLDGTETNGYFWVFYASLSDVEFTVVVTDTDTGNTVAYYNPSGSFASVGDVEALPGDSKSGGWATHTYRDVGGADADLVAGAETTRTESATAVVEGCTPGESALCLNDNRFRVEVVWEDFKAEEGTGHAVPLTDDTGYFWFFDEDNVELVVKVLDGVGVNDYYWVYYGALSNVQYTITVTDTTTGTVRTYSNPLGTFASVGDSQAFPGP